MLVEIDDKIVSTDLFSEKFVCDLSKCKGACCVKGNGGAPLTGKEVELIEDNLEQIKPFMSEKGIQTLQNVLLKQHINQEKLILINRNLVTCIQFGLKSLLNLPL